MNTPESSPSGNVHGMPLAALIGYGAPELVELLGYKPKVEPRNVALVGVRDLDPKERRLIKESGVHAFTMRDIDERGMRDVMSEALRFVTDDTDGVAVSLDMDFVDPDDAPGVGTPVRGGVTYREAHLAMEMIADSEAMVSLEVVEINPVIDLHNKTALLGVEMILSALGKKIPASSLAGQESGHELDDSRKEAAARRRDLRRAIGRARSVAGLGGVGDSRARPGKIRSGAHRHHQGRPLARRDRRRRRCCPEVLRAGERVMLSADPNVAALVPLDEQSRAGRAARGRGVSRAARHLWRGRHGAGPARSGRASLRRLGRAGLRGGHGQGHAEAAVPAGKLPVGDFLAIPRAEWEQSRAKVLRAMRKKFRFPVFVKPATLGSSVGMTKVHDAQGTGHGAGLRRRIRAENPGRARHPRPRNRSCPSWATKIRRRPFPARSFRTANSTITRQNIWKKARAW